MSQMKTDEEALRQLGELENLKKQLNKIGTDLATLSKAVSDPVNWRISDKALAGYGNRSAQNINVPFDSLGALVYEYQQRHYRLSVLQGISSKMREYVNSELNKLDRSI